MSPETRKRLIWVLFALLAVPVAVWVAWRVASARSAATLQQTRVALRREIDRELPTGSPKTRVVAFLSTHNLQTTGHREIQNSKITPDRASEVIYATSNPIRTALFFCRIVVEFRFDESSRMVGYRDMADCTGPF